MEYSLQFYYNQRGNNGKTGHNPCFSGILFAIFSDEGLFLKKFSHNPCFSGILFAMNLKTIFT